MLEGKPDYSKGSYYANPLYDRPTEDADLIKKYPSFCAANIWPKGDLPELEPAFKEMGQLVFEVGLLVARQCDKYVHKLASHYPSNKLYNIVKQSKTCKGRLLHYFPLSQEQQQPSDDQNSISSWCGWHNDHGSLTGLVPAMYITKTGNIIPSPDPKAGLYIRSRHGKMVRVSIPSNNLAFQIGETAQVHSGGLLQATPHCVRGAQGPQSEGVSRETYAMFMEPMWDEKMMIPEGCDVDNVTRGSSTQHLPPGVPLLGKRWNSTQDFGQFTEVTLKSYY